MKEDSIISERAKNTGGKIKGYFTRKSVGGQINEKDYHLWIDYKQRCCDYKIKMNPEGMEHILKLSNKIDSVFFPIARASGINPILFTEERIDILLDEVKNNKDWITATEKLHKNIITKTDKNIVMQVKKK